MFLLLGSWPHVPGDLSVRATTSHWTNLVVEVVEAVVDVGVVVVPGVEGGELLQAVLLGLHRPDILILLES